MRASVKALSIGALAATSLFIAPAAIAADSTATVAVAGGSLTASATDVTLEGVTTAHAAQNSTGNLTLTVDDLSGTGDGWNVTQQVGAFTYSGTNGGTNIGAANFSVTTAGPATSTAGADATGVTTGGTTVGTLDTAKTVASATVGNGEGAYTVPVDVNLVVPADSRAGNYSATLTTTVTPVGP